MANVLPIAVRRYVNAARPDAGAALPCANNQSQFMDFFATADTACLGTETNTALRTEPVRRQRVRPRRPRQQPGHHGPVVAILGQGAQPGNGADFRGFIALDIRNFATTGLQLYYNDVTSGDEHQHAQGAWKRTGSPSAAIADPPSRRRSRRPTRTTRSRSSMATRPGIAIDAIIDRFVPGDEVLVAVYPGNVMAIPDFTIIAARHGLSADDRHDRAAPATMKVSRNQAFTGGRDADDAGRHARPRQPAPDREPTGTPPVTYSPNRVTRRWGPARRRPHEHDDRRRPTGIYTIWVQGQAGSALPDDQVRADLDQDRHRHPRLHGHLRRVAQGRAPTSATASASPDPRSANRTRLRRNP